MKLCPKCNIEKPYEDWYKDKNRTDGLNYTCIDCHKTYSKNLYQRYDEELKQTIRTRNAKRTKDWYNSCIENKQITWFNSRKSVAKRKGIPFTITIDEILPIPDVCPILGIRLERSNVRMNDSSPSIDIIIPELGYVSGNVIVISNRANRLKDNGTAQEHYLIAKFLKGRKTE